MPPQSGALADGKLRAQFRLHQPGQGEVEVIASEQQVLADGGAREVDAVAIAGYADQAEVAGAAADVADEHDLAVEEQLARAGEIVGDPGIEGRGRLFEQRQLRDARLRGGGYGQLAGFFVERRRHGEDNVVIGDRAGLRALPCFADLGKKAGRNIHRREHARALRRIPGQDPGVTIDVRIGEPAFGRVHQLGGHEGALLTGMHADGLAVIQKQKRR